MCDGSAPPAGGAAALCDLTGNGYLDIVLCGDETSDQVVWYENPGADQEGEWVKRVAFATGNCGFADMVLADNLLGDGRRCLLMTNLCPDGTQVLCAPLPADAKSTWPAPLVLASGLMDENAEYGISAPSTGLAVGDLDGDGHLEFVCGNYWFKREGASFACHRYCNDRVDSITLNELLKEIEELRAILASEQKVLDIIKEEMLEIKKKYADERRTSIDMTAIDYIEDESLIPVEDIVVALTHKGYVKRMARDTYKLQNKGGVGIKGMSTNEEDFVEILKSGKTHDHVMFFTNKGKVYRLKGYEIPEFSRQSKGLPIINLLPIEKDEKINSILLDDDSENNKYPKSKLRFFHFSTKYFSLEVFTMFLYHCQFQPLTQPYDP